MCNCVCPYLKSAVRKWPTKRRNELDLPPEGHNLYPIKRFLGENLKTSETTETKTSENMFGKPENTSWKNDRNTTRTTNVARKTLFRHLYGVLCRGILPGWKLQVAGSIQKTKRIYKDIFENCEKRIESLSICSRQSVNGRQLCGSVC